MVSEDSKANYKTSLLGASVRSVKFLSGDSIPRYNTNPFSTKYIRRFKFEYFYLKQILALVKSRWQTRKI